MTNSKFLGLRTTIYLVDDVAAAKRWYSQVFGVEPYFDEPFYIGFNIGGYELGLQPQQNTGVKVPTVLSYWGVED
ncbi:MAG: VOC family protein, partial [Saprospiraceae bacterium]|nr:VOC family protein [Saprospiraceae bacterium]